MVLSVDGIRSRLVRCSGVAGVVVASRWTAILGGNLFWVLGALYLPLLGLSHLIRTRGTNGTLSSTTIFVWAYLLGLAKILSPVSSSSPPLC
jgi:hypothetical protein